MTNFWQYLNEYPVLGWIILIGGLITVHDVLVGIIDIFRPAYYEDYADDDSQSD